jgi:hypothetical protein
MMGYGDDASVADSILKAVVRKYDEVIIGIHQFNKYPARNFGFTAAALALVKNIQQSTHAITMVFGNPYALKNFCDAKDLVACYEDDPVFQQEAFNWLSGDFVAHGKLPVTVCDAFHYGDGIDNYGLLELQKTKPSDVYVDSNGLLTIDTIANTAIYLHAFPVALYWLRRTTR